MATEAPHPQPLSRCHTYLGGTHRALRSGHGIYIFENQFFRYEGEWVKGKKHGFGKLLLKDGTYYEGHFNQGEITGTGFKYFSATKCKYKGQFVKGEMHGRGCMEYPDGAIYDGTFVHNRKNGYGVMKTPLTQYTGGYDQNMRHGEGCMVYAPMRRDRTSNGDRYEGYWEADKRHGKGRLYCADGSLYDGNFYYDEFSGQGLFKHISGVVYDGLWNNGFPANMASKLKIVIDSSPMTIRQGTPFSITVHCLNDEGELVADNGREIQITAGFRYYQPSKGSALFDMIEDVEDRPIDTPFGYQVVHYPITNQVPDQQADTTEDDDDKEDELMASTNQLDRVDEDDNQNADEVKEGEEGGDNEEKTNEEKAEGDDGEKQDEEPEETSQNIEKESIPLPPPVPSCRTEEGVSSWDYLQLAPAPPMYRPFVAMEEAENESKNRSRSKGSVRQGAKSVTSAGPKSVTSAVEKRIKAKEKALEEKYAKTGEYVLMVHDVTSPPFLQRTLEPDFLLLKLKRPEAKKRKEKEGKKWDTSQHIRASMHVTEDDE